MQDDKKRLQIRDESLSPDEEHSIEVRVDKMLHIDEPGSPPAASDDTPKKTSKAKKAKEAKEIPVEAPAAIVLEPAAPEAEIKEIEPPETEAEPEPEPAEEPEPTKPEPTDEIAALAAEDEDGKPASDSASSPSQSDTLAAKERESEIAKQDAELAAAFQDPKKQEGSRFKRFMKAWWHNPKARWGTVAGLVLLLIVAAILPGSRAWALNLAGMRATAAVIVLDGGTQLPLKNVKVQVGGAAAATDAQGKATLHKVKLGKQSLIIQKVAFATLKKNVSVGFGTNQLGTQSLKAVGAQYKLLVVDYVTGKPIATAQAASGESTAIADGKGAITLTAGDTNDDTLAISVTADNYRTETVNVPVGNSDTTTVQLVLARHEVYVSNQSGKYDVYKADLDGKNKKVILAGTGNETSAIALVPHPTADEVALVDTRDGTKDNGGYLLQTLTLINVTTGAPTAIDHSEKIQVIDWQGDRVVYVMAKAGASAANSSRYQLMSYDYRTNQRLELDHANAFNDVVSANGSIYYATANAYNGGISQFVKINADSTDKQVLLASEVWNIFRKDFNDFFLGSGDTNYTFKLGDSKPAATKDSFDGSGNRLYIDSPDGKHSLWVDNRDGKGTLLVTDTKTQKETTLAQQDGITYPVRWISNDSVIFRVKTSQETADYIIGLSTDTAKKITDVNNVTGRSLWYFY